MFAVGSEEGPKRFQVGACKLEWEGCAGCSGGARLASVDVVEARPGLKF